MKKVFNFVLYTWVGVVVAMGGIKVGEMIARMAKQPVSEQVIPEEDVATRLVWEDV
jgi:uncharacterized membrane-anchored protein YhcB (DUF1043 family)